MATEFKKGDLVASKPNNDYQYLVGTVTAIEPVGSPEHDTDNETDDIHVDFNFANYSDARILGIEHRFENLYGKFQKFEELPLDDVIMAPDMLVKIGGYQFEKFAQNLKELKKFLKTK